MEYRNRIIHGHVLDVLKELPSGCVDICITSPPYFGGLRDYGTEPLVWDGDPECNHIWGDEIIEHKRGVAGGRTAQCGNTKRGLGGTETKQGQFCQCCGAWLGSLGLEPDIGMYINHIVQIFKEIRRVLKDWSIAWIVIGDSYAGSGKAGSNPEYQKRHTQFGQIEHKERLGKPLKVPNGLKSKDLYGIPWEIALALRGDGWWLRSALIWSKNCMPESVQGSGWYRHKIYQIIDGKKEYVECPGCEKCEANSGYVLRWNAGRPTKSHDYILLLSKSSNYFYDQEAILEDCSPSTHMRLSQDIAHQVGSYRVHGGAKINGPMKATATMSKQVPAGQGIKYNESFNDAVCLPVLKRNKRSVWTVSVGNIKEAHYATFPEKLVEPMILAGSSQRGNCAKCGKPWMRIIERGFTDHDGKTDSQYEKGTAANRLALLRQAAREKGQEYVNESRTLGWKPSCKCGIGETIRPIVLDPFLGSGTTALESKKLNRDFVGIELKAEYVEMAERLLKSEMPLFIQNKNEIS